MNEAEREAYVRAALALHGYSLDEARTAEIIRQFARIADIAAPLIAFELPYDAEPAPVFRL